MKTTILVLSDIHGVTEPAKEIINKVKHDYVIFAGDYCSSDEQLRHKIDFFIIGNNDYDLIGKEKEEMIIEIGETRILLIHGHKQCNFTGSINRSKIVELAKQNNCKVAIYGHTHVRSYLEVDGVVLFNPGSISFPRDGLKNSYGLITIENNELQFKHFDYI